MVETSSACNTIVVLFLSLRSFFIWYSNNVKEWSPCSSVGDTGLSGGSKSYVFGMAGDSSGFRSAPSVAHAPSSGVSSGFKDIKKSYSMSKWSPGKTVRDTGVAGGTSYLSSMATGTKGTISERKKHVRD